MSTTTPDHRFWQGSVAEPTMTRDPKTELLTMTWPDHAPDVALVQRDVLAMLVEEINLMHALVIVNAACVAKDSTA